MSSEKKYYEYVDYIRILSCVAVLLYHLGFLKGGYLAVCCFFVLSGYLSCVSAFKKEKFLLSDYFKNKFFKLYLPLLLVSFFSIAAVSLFPSIKWLNLKVETKSVLLGYNNFWQLSANLDYFARHVNSPFIHFWYIAILLQFDLIFPFIFIFLKKMGDKYKEVSVYITIILAGLAAGYFFGSSLNSNIMYTYYSTFTRIYSILLGVVVGFIHHYYGLHIPFAFDINEKSKGVYFCYLILLVLMFIFVASDSKFFAICMLLSSFITCRMIDYAMNIYKYKNGKLDKFFKHFASISYEIYLFQYPLIFLFQGYKSNLKYLFIVVLLLVFSITFHYGFSVKKKDSSLIVFAKSLFIVYFSVIGVFGCYKFIMSKDYTKEMNNLQKELSINDELMKKKQLEYEQNLALEEEKWLETVNSMTPDEDSIRKFVTEASVVGVGDSVMLGAVDKLYEVFPNSYFDAKVSRTGWVVNGILQELSNSNKLGNIIILNVGANGDCSDACKIDIMNTLEGKEVFWVNVTNDNDVHINAKLNSFATYYDNLHIIDWNSLSSGHPEFFVADGIHLTPSGVDFYANSIFDSIVYVYKQKYEAEKQEMIDSHNASKKDILTFFGNDILFNVFDELEDNFNGSKFEINNDYNYLMLKSELEESILNNTLSNKIVFAFDSQFDMDYNQYVELMDLLAGREVYLLATSSYDLELASLYNNVYEVDLYSSILSDKSFMNKDNIHLSDKGNKQLIKLLKKSLK